MEVTWSSLQGFVNLGPRGATSRQVLWECGVKRVLQKLFGGTVVGRFYLPQATKCCRERGSALTPNVIADEFYRYEPEAFQTIFSSSSGEVFVESGEAVRRSDGCRVELILQKHGDGEVLVVERPVEERSALPQQPRQ